MVSFRSLLLSAVLAVGSVASAQDTGSVIFIHPDGTGANTWGAARMLLVGPDGDLHWDKLSGMALYRGHMKDALTGTSHGGGTVHAYGVKVVADSLGMDGTTPLKSASGKDMSILREAKAAGLRIGVINSATITDAGTAAFLASVPKRSDHESVAAQILESGADVILGGGEVFFLPQGKRGRHGAAGMRRDGRDLIEEAKKAGYAVVFTREELKALPADTAKVLGLFAPADTFNGVAEDELLRQRLPLYYEQAPTVGEMLTAALPILSRGGQRFALVLEEEGTDNFGNSTNAMGVFEAARRADAAIGVARDFVVHNPNTQILVAADSDAGGMQVWGPYGDRMPPERPLYRHDRATGAEVDGREGSGTPPFISAPDANGKSWPFGIIWCTDADVTGGILVRGEGMNVERIRGNFDNTRIYKEMYFTLFGVDLLKP